MITLLSVENKAGINVGIDLTADQETKYDLNYNKGSFKVGKIHIFSVVILIALVIYILRGLPFIFSNMFLVKFPGFFFGFIYLFVVFVASTRNTELDKTIADNEFKSFVWTFLLGFCIGLILLVPMACNIFLVRVCFTLVFVFISIMVLYYSIYALILVIQKILLYFFATEEEKNQWKEEFIKENKLQPIGNNVK